MTTKERVLQFLKDRPLKSHTPTEIGVALGKEYNQASSFVSSSLKNLEKEQLIIRISNKRSVVYQLK